MYNYGTSFRQHWQWHHLNNHTNFDTHCSKWTSHQIYCLRNPYQTKLMIVYLGIKYTIPWRESNSQSLLVIGTECTVRCIDVNPSIIWSQPCLNPLHPQIWKIFSGHLHVYYIPNLRCNSNMEDSNSCCLDNRFSLSSVNDVICAKTGKIFIEIFRCHVTSSIMLSI